jgi:hypothetical protein
LKRGKIFLKIGVKIGIPDDGLREESLKEANDRGGKLGLERSCSTPQRSTKSTHSETLKGNVRAATRALWHPPVRRTFRRLLPPMEKADRSRQDEALTVRCNVLFLLRIGEEGIFFHEIPVSM